MRMISVRLQLISQVPGSSRWLADTAQLPRFFFPSIRLVGDVKPSLEFVHLEIDLDSGTFFFVKRKNGTMDVARVTCLVTCWVTCRVWASDVVSSLTLKSQKRPVGFGSKALSNNTPLDGLFKFLNLNSTKLISEIVNCGQIGNYGRMPSAEVVKLVRLLHSANLPLWCDRGADAASNFKFRNAQTFVAAATFCFLIGDSHLKPSLILRRLRFSGEQLLSWLLFRHFSQMK